MHPIAAESVHCHFGSPRSSYDLVEGMYDPTYGHTSTNTRTMAVCLTCGALVPDEPWGRSFLGIHAEWHDKETTGA